MVGHAGTDLPFRSQPKGDDRIGLMTALGQKCPKRLLPPAGKNTHEHMGRFVPKRAKSVVVPNRPRWQLIPDSHAVLDGGRRWKSWATS
jgi:hypothetical protein